MPHGLNLWVVADNLRKGAATNAVQAQGTTSLSVGTCTLSAVYSGDANFQAGAAAPLRGPFEAFCVQEGHWLNDFALFMALKDAQAPSG